MSLTQFFGILAARRWMVIAAVLATLAGAIAAIVILPPRYQASSRVMLDIVKPDPVTGEVIGNQFLRAYTKTQIELIRDYKVAGPVVDELGWTQNPTLLAQYGVAGDPNVARRRLAEVIIDNTEARLIDGSNILEITYTAWSPDAAKQVADAIRRSYVDATLAFKRTSASEAANWYQVQAEKARRLLVFAEDQKAKYERANGLILQADKTDVDSERLQALAGQQAGPAAGVSFSQSPASSAAATQLAQLDAQIAQARQTLGPNHPSLRESVQRRDLLAQQVNQERSAANSAAAAARAAAGAAGSGAASNERLLDAQRARVLANRDKLSALRQLQDEVDLRRDQYVKAAARAAELRLQGDVSEAGLTLLGNAVAPEDPSFPNIPLIVSAALGFGFIFGVLAALLTEFLRRKVRSSRDMESAADQVPLLAVVGARPEANAGLVNLVKSRLRLRREEQAIAA